MIHSSCSVGLTGWIGGAAILSRTIDAAELRSLSVLRQPPTLVAEAAP